MAFVGKPKRPPTHRSSVEANRKWFEEHGEDFEMSDVDKARVASLTAHRERIKATMLHEDVQAEYRELASKLEIVAKKRHDAESAAHLADCDVHIAICNSVADGRVTREQLRKKIRRALYLRKDYRPNRSKKVRTYEDNILDLLESTQIFSGGFRSIPEIRDVHLNIRGSSSQRDLTDKQRERVMAVIAEYCPRRPDDGEITEGIKGVNLKGYATPYRIERYEGYKIRAVE